MSPSAMVKSISEICRRNLTPRIIGFDDAPFQTRPRVPGSEVHAVGVVTSSDRFEGMLYCGEIEQDGMNAGPILRNCIQQSKFHDQIHAVFLDGISMGGLNLVNIQHLATQLERPVVSVMRGYPNIRKMLDAIAKLSHAKEREEVLRLAGPIHQVKDWTFQYRCPLSGDAPESQVTPTEVAVLLDRCTPNGTQKIPECLRLAHLIGAAIKTGQSSSSA